MTAVGGTSDVTPEVAWNASSGGFSNYFSRAWYQQSAVKTYFNHVSSETKEYYSKYADFEGRGFPDVSAHSLYPEYVYSVFLSLTRSDKLQLRSD